LKLTSRYYPSKIPERALAALEEACPWLLRTMATSWSLNDVSFSYLWVDAFPGIGWSQSLPEAFDYAINRVRPSAKHLAARKENLRSQSWARQGDWSRLSQGRRIIRWITTRQTRPVTMLAVNAALEQAR
jgi:hypothetical protein